MLKIPVNSYSLLSYFYAGKDKMQMKTKGFTLIELLVVIAIIAVLMAILFPSLRAAKDHAKRIHCVSNVKTLALAWFMYAEDNDDKLVGGRTDNRWDWVGPVPGGQVPIEEKKDAIRDGALFPYVSKTIDVYRCPADMRKKQPQMNSFRSYSIVGGANGEWSEPIKATRYSDIKRPAFKYVFVEETDPRGYNVNSWVMNVQSKSWIDPLAIWHNKQSTLGFADGHAEMHRWVNQSTIDWCHTSFYEPSHFNFGMTPPANEQEDVEYMARHFACKSVK